METHAEEFAAWLAATERRLKDLGELGLVLEDAERALGERADQLFNQLAADGYDHATVEQALAQAGTGAAATARTAAGTSPSATVRLHRSGKMV